MSEFEPGPLDIVRPRRGLRGLREEMQRLWAGFPGLFPEPRSWRWPFFEELRMPAVDMFEKDGSLVIKADVPGMSAKDIEISVNGDTLTISGERKEEKEVKEEDYYRAERSYGRFTRQIALPAGVDTDKADAQFKDGVVEIRLPLKKEAQKKTIPVKSAAG
ncbi:MAG TPA: Hsp20/alpha crystallin family protein [Dehalococcoidia bacterium]|nr:Hsp20/alpha crystallin family protein [Dehalococcoidia bacterium]